MIAEWTRNPTEIGFYWHYHPIGSHGGETSVAEIYRVKDGFMVDSIMNTAVNPIPLSLLSGCGDSFLRIPEPEEFPK